MEKQKKESKFVNFINKYILADGIGLVGEGIVDLVLCYVIISVLLNNEFIINVISNGSKLYSFMICLGILLVPIHYCSKWLNIIFEAIRRKEK